MSWSGLSTPEGSCSHSHSVKHTSSQHIVTLLPRVRARLSLKSIEIKKYHWHKFLQLQFNSQFNLTVSVVICHHIHLFHRHVTSLLYDNLYFTESYLLFDLPRSDAELICIDTRSSNSWSSQLFVVQQTLKSNVSTMGETAEVLMWWISASQGILSFLPQHEKGRFFCSNEIVLPPFLIKSLIS